MPKQNVDSFKDFNQKEVQPQGLTLKGIFKLAMPAPKRQTTDSDVIKHSGGGFVLEQN